MIDVGPPTAAKDRRGVSLLAVVRLSYGICWCVLASGFGVLMPEAPCVAVPARLKFGCQLTGPEIL